MLHNPHGTSYQETSAAPLTRENGELFGVLLQQTKAVDLALLSTPPAIETMVQFLDSPEVSVRQKAANCLSALTFPSHAKPLATSAGAIEKLVLLLSDV